MIQGWLKLNSKHALSYEEVEMIAVENREELMVVNLRFIFFVKVLENSLGGEEKKSQKDQLFFCRFYSITLISSFVNRKSIAAND